MALTRFGEAEPDRGRATPRGGLSALSDAELLARVQRQDEAALAALYDRYGGLVYTIALRVVGDRGVAEEVLQDAFLRCWNGAETYRAERGQVAGWLVTIARNRAIDALRSRQHHARQRESTPLPEPPEPDALRTPDESDAIATRQAVSAAMASLPQSQRAVVELAYYGGLSQTEIARQLGEPLGTVKSRTRAALDRLRLALRPYFGPDVPDGRDR